MRRISLDLVFGLLSYVFWLCSRGFGKSLDTFTGVISISGANFAKWIQRAISIRSKMNMFSGVILVFGANFSKNATFGHVYGGYFGFTSKISPRTQKFGHVYGGCFGFRSKFSPKTQSLGTFTGYFGFSGANFSKNAKVWTRLRGYFGIRSKFI